MSKLPKELYVKQVKDKNADMSYFVSDTEIEHLVDREETEIGVYELKCVKKAKLVPRITPS